MKTTITYKINKIVLENAVRECIFSGIPTIIKNVKRIIQGRVYNGGLSAIDFPENWFFETIR